LGKLGNVESLPSMMDVETFASDRSVEDILNNSSDGLEKRERLHELAKELLAQGQVDNAWKALLCDRLNRN
jgi:hypothetical protein